MTSTVTSRLLHTGPSHRGVNRATALLATIAVAVLVTVVLIVNMRTPQHRNTQQDTPRPAVAKVGVNAAQISANQLRADPSGSPAHRTAHPDRLPLVIAGLQATQHSKSHGAITTPPQHRRRCIVGRSSRSRTTEVDQANHLTSPIFFVVALRRIWPKISVPGASTRECFQTNCRTAFTARLRQ